MAIFMLLNQVEINNEAGFILEYYLVVFKLSK